MRSASASFCAPVLPLPGSGVPGFWSEKVLRPRVFSCLADECAHRVIGQFRWSTFCFFAAGSRAYRIVVPPVRPLDFWPEFSSSEGMPFSGTNICAQLVFGSIGFVGFAYGKKMHAWKPMF